MKADVSWGNIGLLTILTPIETLVTPGAARSARGLLAERKFAWLAPPYGPDSASGSRGWFLNLIDANVTLQSELS